MRETFELLRNEIRAAGVGMLPAGIILTGGAAQLAGAAELGREVLQMPVRVAAPAGIGGLVDTLLNPSYSTAVGLLQWGASSLASGEPPLRIGAGAAAASAACATPSGASSRRLVGRCVRAPPGALRAAGLGEVRAPTADGPALYSAQPHGPAQHREAPSGSARATSGRRMTPFEGRRRRARCRCVPIPRTSR